MFHQPSSVLVKVVDASPEMLAKLNLGGDMADEMAAWLRSWIFEDARGRITRIRLDLLRPEQMPEGINDGRQARQDEGDTGQSEIEDVLFPGDGTSKDSAKALLEGCPAPRSDADSTKSGSENGTIGPALADAGNRAGSGDNDQSLPPFEVFPEPHEIHAVSPFKARPAPWWDWLTWQTRNASYFTLDLGVQS